MDTLIHANLCTYEHKNLTNSDVLGRPNTLTRAHVHTYVHTYTQLTNSDVLGRPDTVTHERTYL